jgi:hypothetical protein
VMTTTEGDSGRATLPSGTAPYPSPWHRVHVPGARWCTLSPPRRGAAPSAIAPWHVCLAPAMARFRARHHEAHAMATMVMRSAPFLASPALAGVARALLPQRGTGLRLAAVRAAASLEAALGDCPRPTLRTPPAPWSTP